MHAVQYAAWGVLAAAVIVTVVLALESRRYRKRRQRERPVYVTLTADTSQYEQAMRNAARALDAVKWNLGTALTPMFANMVAVMADFERSLKNVGRIMVGTPPWALDPKLREVHIAGLESKMYVRAGMDPHVASPDGLDALVSELSHLPHLTPGERAGVIAAAYRGWVNHRPGPPPETFAYHRLIGDETVVFTRG